jgi:outer membrane lipoprotein-sorting protein
MHTLLKSLVSLAAFIIAISAYGNDADSVLAGLMAGIKNDSYYAELTMTTIRPHFTREITASAWNIKGEFSIITVKAPFRDKGMTFMMTGSDIWNYVPARNQMTKLHSSMMAQPWMGSDFVNYDLIGDLSGIRENFTSVITGRDEIEGKECYVIKLTPVPDSLKNQGFMIIWVTKDKFQHLKTENYDQEGRLVRMISLGEIKTIHGREIPTRIEIKPEKKGHATIINFTDISFDSDIINRIAADQSIATIIDLLPENYYYRYITTQLTDK